MYFLYGEKHIPDLPGNTGIAITEKSSGKLNKLFNVTCGNLH